MQSLSPPRRFRPATVDELRLCLADAAPGDLIEPPRDDIRRLPSASG